LWDRQGQTGLQGRLEPLLAFPALLDHLVLAPLAPLVLQEQHQLWLGQLGLQAPLGRLAMLPLCPAQLVLLVFPAQLVLLARILLLLVPRVQQELLARPARQVQIRRLLARPARLATLGLQAPQVLIPLLQALLVLLEPLQQ
jgi:hypothetical protein